MPGFEKRTSNARPGNRNSLFHISETVLVILLLGLFLSLVSCGEPQAPEAVVRFGLVTTLSGPYGESYGIPTLQAARLAVENINAAGGLDVGGQKIRIELLVEDDEDNPEKSVSAAYKLINQMEVAALVAPHMSRNAIPLAQIAEMARVPTISPTSTNEDTTKDKKYVFRACFVDTFQGEILAEFARQTLKAETAAILYDEASAYNRGLAEVFKRAFEKEGGRITANERYVTGRMDFGPLLLRIREKQPRVLFIPNYADEALVQARQAREIGIDAVLLGSDTLDSLQTYPDAMDGAYFTDHWHVSLVEHGDNPEVRAFLEKFCAQYKNEPTVAAAFTYDTIGLLARAIRFSGRYDSESIKDGLIEMGPYKGVTGSIDYISGGDPKRNAVLMHIENGKAVFKGELGPGGLN